MKAFPQITKAICIVDRKDFILQARLSRVQGRPTCLPYFTSPELAAAIVYFSLAGLPMRNFSEDSVRRAGECVAGKSKGQKLDRVIPEPGSWFAWAEFHQDTQIFSSESH
jgi:hypothetical protein